MKWLPYEIPSAREKSPNVPHGHSTPIFMVRIRKSCRLPPPGWWNEARIMHGISTERRFQNILHDVALTEIAEKKKRSHRPAILGSRHAQANRHKLEIRRAGEICTDEHRENAALSKVAGEMRRAYAKARSFRKNVGRKPRWCHFNI